MQAYKEMELSAPVTPPKRGRIVADCERCGKAFSHQVCERRRFCSMKCKIESQRKTSTFKISDRACVIELTRGKEAVVDLLDMDITNFSWCAVPDVRRVLWYAKMSEPNTHKSISMHRAIMERVLGRKLLPTEGIDHKNGNGLDNRRDNLRLASAAENCANTQKNETAGSKFKGVSYHKHQSARSGKPQWEARITANRRTIHLGYFDTEIEAAKAYDKAAREHFGEFAKPNFMEA